MPELVISKPNDKQRLFFMAKKRNIGFGGARGGGKSWAVRIKSILLCLNYPGIKCMIIRKTYAELQENHINPICTMLKCYHPDKDQRIAAYNDAKKNITFPNGSRILFRYCDHAKDAERFQGTEVDALFIDEATQQTEEIFKKLTACVRGVNNYPKRIYITCNPGGVGHQWVKRLFIDRDFKAGENPDEYEFIQSLVTDNKALMQSDPDYYSQLQALPPKLRRAWLDGAWDIFDGQFFEEFRIGTPEEQKLRRNTHVIAPFQIPEYWPIYRSYDFGYGKPFSCGWWASDKDGTVYRIAELYGCTETPNEGVKWTPDRQFAEIKKIEREHPLLAGKQISGVADPAIWDASRGESVAETALKHGITFTPGDNKRIPGWMQMHYRLQFDENGKARMYIFNTCRAAIRTIPLMMYSTTNAEDLDTDLEDHVCDDIRYFLMTRPISAMVKSAGRQIRDDPLNQLVDYSAGTRVITV